jgi:hypothetical protein
VKCVCVCVRVWVVCVCVKLSEKSENCMCCFSLPLILYFNVLYANQRIQKMKMYDKRIIISYFIFHTTSSQATHHHYHIHLKAMERNPVSLFAPTTVKSMLTEFALIQINTITMLLVMSQK